MSLDIRKIFAGEFDEHTEKLERILSRKGPLTPQDIREVFRIFHTIKGSSGLAGYDGVKDVAQNYETLLSEQLNSSTVSTGLTEQLTHGLDDLLSAYHRGNATGSTESDSPSAGSPILKSYLLKLYPDEDSFRKGFEPLSVIRNLKSISRQIHTELDTDALPGIDAMDPSRMYLGWKLRIDTEVPEDQLRKKLKFALNCGNASSLEPVAARQEGGAESAKLYEKSEVLPGSLRIDKELSERLLKITLGLTTDINRLVFITRELAGDINVFTGTMLKLQELQEVALKVRAVPVSSLFERLRLLARRLVRDCDKRVEVIISGGQEEIDRAIMEQLAPNLEHLIRNSIDHGIETTGERLSLGKAPAGSLKFESVMLADRIMITISDDGRGIDRERVVEKGRELGLPIPESDPLELIFVPGFSLREEVSETSGRGVGMDAVRKTVERLGGSIRLETSAGKGTKYTMLIPVKISVFDAALIRSGDSVYAIPLFNVLNSRPVEGTGFGMLKGKRVLYLDNDSFIPIIPFGSPESEKLAVQLKSSSNDRFAILADEFISVEQLVLQSSGDSSEAFESLLGFTITGNGNIVPVINVENIYRRFNTKTWR